MKTEAIYEFLIHDNVIYKTSNMKITKPILTKAVYEVIRIIDGIPLFLEDHLNRLYLSASLAGIELCLTKTEITSLICSLVKLNKQYFANIKILFNDNGQHYYMYFMDTFYPTDKMKEQGIHTVLYDVERENPNAKINNYELRAKITTYRQQYNAFEALLVNKKNCITEGSRSNVFFVGKNTIYTASHQRVLIGITRKKVLSICQHANISVIEREIRVQELSQFCGAFMTSTSNDILPIKSIDSLVYQSSQQELIKLLQEDYQKMILDDITNNDLLCDKIKLNS